MFLIQAESGIKIVTDPYSEKTGYKPPTMSADIVTVSHYHHDHDNISAVDGSPNVMDTIGKYSIEGISIEGISSYHDEVKGEKRGSNVIFKFYLDGLTVVHMGDYGQPEITEEQIRFLKGANVVLIPIGGTYTIDYRQAIDIVKLIDPEVVIPMHYKTKDYVMNVDTADMFIKNMPAVRNKESSVRLSSSEMPKQTEVWVMEYIQ